MGRGCLPASAPSVPSLRSCVQVSQPCRQQGQPSPTLSCQPGPEASPAGELVSFWAWPQAQRERQVPEGRKQGAESGGRASRACAWGPPACPGGILSSPLPLVVSCGPEPALGRRLQDGGDSLGVAVSRGEGAGPRLSPAPVRGAPPRGSVRALAGHGDMRGAPLPLSPRTRSARLPGAHGPAPEKSTVGSAVGRVPAVSRLCSPHRPDPLPPHGLSSTPRLLGPEDRQSRVHPRAPVIRGQRLRSRLPWPRRVWCAGVWQRPSSCRPRCPGGGCAPPAARRVPGKRLG